MNNWYSKPILFIAMILMALQLHAANDVSESGARAIGGPVDTENEELSLIHI